MRHSGPHRAVLPGASETFLLELVKPSHYDDDGYVVQWWRGSVPSNTLAVLHGIAADAGARRALGEAVRIEIGVHDETTEVLPLDRIIRRFERNDRNGLACLVGVQTNQFPRAIDIARELRGAGIQVAIGGFHVSGCLAMLPELPAELREAQALGICLFAGELEGRLDEVLRAAQARQLPPLYDFTRDLPRLNAQPLPMLPARQIRKYLGNIATVDAGRGCPFTCSFCTIINVQGRTSRHRSADDVEQVIRAATARGARHYFVTDDNFARNENWEPILDRLIALREEHGFHFHLSMQVDTACHKIPRFIEKAARAGCSKVFIGLETIRPDNLRAASKGQNQITEYRAMLQAWRRARVLTCAGYILGFPHDTPESIARDIAIIQRELPIDILEFGILTPGAGSRDHRELVIQGTPLAADLNLYDTEHVVAPHSRMTAGQWQDIYERAWHLYYSPAHVQTLLRRAMIDGAGTRRVADAVFLFYGSVAYEGVHPLQLGLLRRKSRRHRRPGLPREPLLPFAVRRAGEMCRTYFRMVRFLLSLRRQRRRVEADPAAHTYCDRAMMPVSVAPDDAFELYRTSDAARQAADRARVRAAARAARADG